MSLLKALGLGRAKAADQPDFVERRAEERRAVFQEAVLMLDDRFKLRVVITNLSARGAGIAFDTRMELPFRVRIAATTMKLNCWARVAWQHDGAAGLEFQPGDEAL